MTCFACKTTIPSGAKACPNCGLLVPTVYPPSQADTGYRPAEQPVPTSWTPTQQPTAPVWPAPPQPSPSYADNDSGTGPSAHLPAELAGFSWGGFAFTWLWAVFNKTYIGVIGIIPFINYIMSFVLGFKGYQWAWQNRQWESVEQFKAVQRKWNMWAIGYVILGIVACVLSVLFPLLAQMRGH